MKQPVSAILFPVIWPLGTTAAPACPPWATIILLVLNLAMLAALAIIPEWLHGNLALGETPRAYQFLTCAFVPSCLLTGLTDMLFLWTLAPTLERRLGLWKVLLLFTACGALGAVAHQAMQGPAHEPLAGAAAPLMGLAGAMVVIFPRAVVRIYIGMIFLITPIFARVLRVPVLLATAIYILLQYLFHRLEAVGDLPFVLDRTVFSPGALLGGLAGGAALTGILHREALAPQGTAGDRPVTMTEEAESAIFDAPESAAAPLEPRPADEAPPAPPQPAMESIDALFGNPEDSDATGVAPQFEQAPKPQVIEKNPVDTDPVIRLDEGGAEGAGEGGQPEEEPKTRRNEPARAEAAPQPGPALEAKACLTDESTMAGEPARPPRREPGDTQYHAPKIEAPEREDEPGRARPERTAEASPGGITEPKAPVRDHVWSRSRQARPAQEQPPEPPEEDDPIHLQLEPSEDTLAQAQALKDDTAWPDVQAGRFSVILAPGRPRKIASVVTELANLLDLSLKGAYQTLRHRHGILVDNVPREEAERVAERFARAGHAVLLVALTNRINFGGGLDLISIQEHGDHALFTTVAQMIRAEWSQIVFLAGGRVTITPGTPPRVVLDIFLVKPRHHLRLWDNTFSYSKEMPKFRTQVLRITENARGAIHTRSLDKWLRDENETLHPFDNMIEYEHYVRWHLMAHLTPTKLVK